VRTLFRYAAVLAVIASPAASATIDIRDCPLDTLVFVDPWVGESTFTVARVGANREWQCKEGVTPPDDSCRGPYGDLVLEGTYRQYESSEPQTMSAVWSVIDGVPCCDWNVEEGTASAAAASGFTWFGKDDAPRLKDMPWLSIDSNDYEDFGNPLFAATCELR
jgi:hypothetical protein